MPIKLVREVLGPAWKWFNRLFEENRFFELLAAMTVFALILHLSSPPRLRDVITIVGVAGILDRRLLRRSGYWFLITGLLVVDHILLWDVLDNHKYLQTYWCLAFALACLVPGRTSAVAINARLLIGFCFLFAAAWKVLSTEFLNGAFFEFTLLTDRRFSGFADLVGGVPADVARANTSALERLLEPYGLVDVIRFEDTPRIAAMAKLISYWTLAIEGTIALVFLLPERFRLASLRDPVLLLFVLSTYPIATVVGFGRILAVMGLAQSRNRFGVERAAYVLCFLLLPLYRFPFARLIRMLLG